MTQAEFERELSRATGESLGTLRNRGFQLIEPPDLSPLMIDWDELQPYEPARRIQRRPRRQLAAV
jgi:hypothetical protein